MARPSARKQQCSRAEATTRLRQAAAFLEVAELALSDDTDTATPSVAASLAVLAGIAASDAACCARLGQRTRGQDHRQAVSLIATVQPGGPAMAKDLKAILAVKDDSHYGLELVSAGKAAALIKRTKRLLTSASVAVAA